MQSPVRNKRARSAPTFLTPVRPLKRAPIREQAPDKLYQGGGYYLLTQVKVWSRQEISLLAIKLAL